MPTNFVELLNSILAQRKAKNSKYSLRALARSLGISPASLSLILAGKREISTRHAIQILDKLRVTDPDIHTSLVKSTISAKSAPKKTVTYTELDLERFAIIRNWEHFALLAAIDIDPKISEAALAKKFDLKISVVRDAIARLTRVGLLKKTASGWSSVQPNQETRPTPTPNSDLRECHRQHIEKALDSLRNDPIEKRHISGTTMTLSPEKFGLAAMAIMEFHRKLSELADDGNATTVYRLNIQFFPLAKEAIK